MKFLKKLLAIVAIIVAIICVIMAIIATSGGAAVSLSSVFGFLPSIGLTTVQFGWMGWAALGITGLAIAYMCDQETASKYLDKAGSAIKDAVDQVTDIVGSGIGSVVKNIPWYIWAAGAVTVYYLFWYKPEQSLVLKGGKSHVKEIGELYDS